MSTNIKKLKFILEKANSKFDRAIAELTAEYAEKLKENNEWKTSTQTIIDDMERDYHLECEFREGDHYVEPPVTSMDYVGAVSENNSARFFGQTLDEELIAINEVQIIYSFKQIEISLKQFLLLLDPSLDLKIVQRWDYLKKEFKKHGITLGTAQDYPAVNDLREVNNALKHSYEISENVKKLHIPQFSGQDYFTHSSLTKFYNYSLIPRASFIIDIALSVGAALNISDAELGSFNPQSLVHTRESSPF
ncbi:hypothetical protein [Pseudoalteromonas luteoviolacea]|uniref:Uncharacterized protein n=1 Tax=Pseudoalteromonas luteoviolacea S4060-1 TaxID=1365257 RepID=A0A162BWZ4_9GAMM|nr:hypothetical protein [Pseudoalteromonas luteoviolacea]KZN70466.1 hypothetical protein N478_00755 [Pseudoalteromonas luteoviolacea S4060-1]